MLSEDLERENQKILKARSAKKSQSETDIYNNCCRKYKETEEHLKDLKQKREKLDLEIEHLQQKQLDRKNFIAEVQQRHQKS